MDYYNKINSLKIKDEKFLYFDCFARNKELILILPSYYEFPELYKDLYVSFGNQQLSLKESIIYEKNEGVIILIYFFDFDVNSFYNIDIECTKLNLKTNLNIFHKGIPKTDDLYVSTLFKNDIYLIPNWINHYKNLGFNKFILYCNHPLEKINSLIEKCKNIIVEKFKDVNLEQDILFLEWNFNYFNKDNIEFTNNIPLSQYVHHAQPAQINHCLWKYSKPLTNYYLNLDLDEYLLLNGDQTLNEDCYIFEGEWTFNKNNKIPLFEVINCKELNDFRLEEKDGRTKYLVNPDSVKCLGINSPKDDIPKRCIENYKLLHLYNWSGKRK